MATIIKKGDAMKNKNNILIYLSVILITILLLSMLSMYAQATYKSSKTSGFSGNISARASVLYEPSNNTFIYEKNGDERLPMASTTKIMTAIVVEKKCAMDETVIIGPESVGIEGSSAYLKEGDLYTVLELIYALLLQSANDAATALAYYTAGSIEEFADLMNAEAENLGLKNTHFTNPHGLDDADHYTTAKDMAILGAALMKSDVLKKAVSTYKKTFTYEDRTRTYINHNKLLRIYDGGTGIKTGFTKRSGRCLVGAAERDGMTFISVTLDAPSDWADHKALLDYAFDSFEKIELCTKEKCSSKIKVLGGSHDYITVSAKENLAVIKEKGKSNIIMHLSLPGYVIAPIKKGDVLGQAVFKVGDMTYTVDLVALDNVNSSRRDTILTKILNKIFR